MAKRIAATAASRRFCTTPMNYEQPLDFPLGSAVARTATNATPASGQRLATGMRVVAQDNGQASATVGLFAEAGAIHESTPGVADALSHMLLTSNLQSSDFHMFKAFQSAGATAQGVQLNKEYVGVKVECRRDTVPEVMRRVVEAVAVPRFATHHLDEVRTALDTFTNGRTLNLADAAVDLVDKVAFAGSPLAGNGLCPVTAIDALTSEKLLEHYAQLFNPERLVLAGVNVTNDELSSAFHKAEWHASLSKENPTFEDARPQLEGNTDYYVGGADLVHFSSKQAYKKLFHYDFTYVGYVRKASPAKTLKDLAVNYVAAGAVGPQLAAGQNGISGLHRRFPGNALVGGLARAEPQHAAGVVQELVKAVNSIGSVSGAALEQAKRTAAVTLLSQTASQDGLLEFLVLNSSSQGVGKTVPDLLQAINDVTAADLAKFHEAAQAVPATYVAIGDLSTVPSARSL